MNIEARLKSTSLFFVILFLTFPGTGRGEPESEIVPKEQILKSVVSPELTRSWPGVRKGYVFQGAPDETDLSRGLSVVPNSVRVEPTANISIPITFALNSATKLTGNSLQQLKILAEALRSADSDDAFLLEGHTCALGVTEYNMRLSIARSNAIRGYLIDAGVKPESLKSMGLGESEAAENGVTEDSSESVLAPYRKVHVHRIRTEVSDN